MMTDLSDLDTVLPEGVQRQHGVPPPPPVDFEDNFTLPVHSTKPLQQLHTHPLDTSLAFYEGPHIYTDEGVPTSGSVTYLAHQYQKPFDAPKAISVMKNSRSQKWPRVEYVIDARPLRMTIQDLTSERGALIVCGGKTIAALNPHSMESSASGEDVLCVLHAARLKTSGSEATDDEEVYTFERVMTDQEIMDAWTLKGKIASNTGTEYHYMCELFLNGMPCRWWEPEMQILFDFVRNHMVPRGIVAWNTEKEIVCRDADIGGSIDAILWDPQNKVHHILDFKRSDKLAGDMHNKFRGKMEAPFTHLDDCRGASYCLQLSIYQYILERDYGFSIGDRILLSIHPDAPFVTSVPYLYAETDFIMRKQFALVQARRSAMELDSDLFRCSLTNAPAVDAVRLEDGSIVMEKAAIVREMDYTPAMDVRIAFENAVKENMPIVAPAAAAECINWKRRVPEEGCPPFV
jgi:hypothetical protein